MKNIQDIIPDREIVQQKPQEFMGISYNVWRVGIPIFSDQVEKLLESGYHLFISGLGHVFVIRQLNPSPEQLRENREFWHNLTNRIEDQSYA